MNQAEIEALLVSKVENASTLAEIVGIRAAHWAHSGIVRPGQRREIEIGRRVELVCRLVATRLWRLARRPAASCAVLDARRLVADAPGLYVVELELSGFVRPVELVAVPTALLDSIGPRNGLNDRALTLRCRINNPGVTPQSLAAALEGDPPEWGTLAAVAT